MKKLIPLLLLIGGISIWWWMQDRYTPRAEYSGTIEADDVAVGSRVGGRIISIEVDEGDAVKTGDVLLRLEREPLEARLKEAEAELERASQQLRELENGSRIQEIEQAKAIYEEARNRWRLLKKGPRKEDIEAARANLEARKAEEELAILTERRQSELFKTRNTSADNLDRARKELAVARNRVRAAEAELNRLLAGFREEDIQAAWEKVKNASAALSLVQEGPRQERIAQARAAKQRAEAAVEKTRIDLDETDIIAPSDGVVETNPHEPGDLLGSNQTALTLILYKPLTVRIYVPESRLGNVPLGKIVQFSVASFPDKTFQGEIVQVNRQAEYTPRNVQTPDTRDDLVFGAKIEIDDPEHLLRPGMVADVFLSSENGPEE